MGHYSNKPNDYWLAVYCASLPVTEADWLAAMADVGREPGFIVVTGAALVTWRVQG